MNELIKIHKKSNGDSVVSARDLHAFLESKRDFSNWIKDRIEKYGFVENQDYTTLTKIVERAKRIEYALILDTAKEIAMVEGNEKGKQARQYFLECERRAKNPIEGITRLDMARMLLEAETERVRLEQENKELLPHKQFSESVSRSKTSILIRDLAKILSQSGHDIGEKRLFSWLRDNGYLIKALGRDFNSPTQKSIDLGVIEFTERTFTDLTGTFTRKTPLITGKGQVYFAKKFSKNNAA